MADFENRFQLPSGSPVTVSSPERGRVDVTVPRRSGNADFSQTAAEFLETAMRRFRTAADAESRMRREQQIDQKFMASEQWPEQVRAERDADGRPCLTVNRLPVFKRQVTNQQRQSKPAIQINPVDSQGDPKTAEVFQGIIRHIEIASNADVAYDTACDSQVTIGRGFFRLLVEWDEMNPWQQDIRIKRIRNPFMVYFDPACQEHDYSDARYAFIVEDIPKDEFKARYGVEALESMQFITLGDRMADWMPEGRVRVAEYFYVEETTEKVAMLSNGQEMAAKTAQAPEMQEWMQINGVGIVRIRTITKRAVKWAKITGRQILEQRDWPGRWIPIIPVLGDELDINGQVDLRGMVRDARDPQRMYNYWVSAETEAIALAPRTPWVGAEGQFEGHENKWKLANRRNFPYLEYKTKSVGNQPLPPPMRQVLEPPIMAITAATRQADNDLKATTGLYDASLGERGPEESARAILARQKQGDMSNSHWVDNLMRAIRFLGKQLIDIIPKIYDAPRVMRIIGIDNQPKMVMVHSGMPEALPSADSEAAMEGVEGIYDLQAGTYDVTVSVGPSYQSRRQEAVEAMTAFMQAFPPAAPVIGDVLAENMDWPGAAIVAKRLRKLVPPEVMDQPGQEQIPPGVQQKMMQMEEQMKLLTSELEEATFAVKAQTVQSESRERIAQMQEQTKLALAQINAQNDVAGEMAKAEAHKVKLGYDAEGHKAKLIADAEGKRAQMGVELEKAELEGDIEIEQKGVDHKHEFFMQKDDQRFQLLMEERRAAHQRLIEERKAKQQQQIKEKELKHQDKLQTKDQRHSAQLSAQQAKQAERQIKLKPKPAPARTSSSSAKKK